MRRVFSNAVILEGDDLEVTCGYLVVDGREIKEISEGSPPRRATDLKGSIILPPFVNAHTHVGDSVGKEMYLGKSQPEVVGPQGAKFEIMQGASPRESVSSISATLEDMLRTGTSAHCDFREGGRAGVNLLRKASRRPLQTVAMGREKNLEELRRVLAKADGIGLSSISVFDSKDLREVSKKAKKKRKLFALHADETEGARKLSVKETGKSEIERALELQPSFVVHATHGSTEDLKLLAKKKTPVVFCPRANQLLSAGVPPVNEAINLGVEFWLGTDNVMVNPPDIFGELRFTWACVRRANERAGGEEARRLLAAATVDPVKPLNLRGGALSPGSDATFLVLSRKNNLLGVSNIHAGVVNRGRADNIREFFVEGKVIFRRNPR